MPTSEERLREALRDYLSTWDRLRKQLRLDQTEDDEAAERFWDEMDATSRKARVALTAQPVPDSEDKA